MPELPEVQTTANMLNKVLPGLEISDVWTEYGGKIHNGKANIKNKKYFLKFKKDIVGQKIKSVTRRGKNVLIHLSNRKTILVHMKMTGHLLFGAYRKADATCKKRETNHKKIPKNKFQIPNGWENEKWIPQENLKSPLWNSFNRFIRLVFILSNGKHLVLSDMRKFAKVTLLETNSLEDSEDLKYLGPEPLEKYFNFKKFKERILKLPNKKIKTALMDQNLIAGVGNIYSDEILWKTSVHPEEKAGNIPDKKLKEIFLSMKKLLKKGIDFGGDSMSDYRNPKGEKGAFQLHHKVYGRYKKKCLKRGCQGEIKRQKVNGRSAHFCPDHQKIRVSSGN